MPCSWFCLAWGANESYSARIVQSTETGNSNACRMHALITHFAPVAVLLATPFPRYHSHSSIASPSVTTIWCLVMASSQNFVVPGAYESGFLLLYLGVALSMFRKRSTLPAVMTVMSTLEPDPRSLSIPLWIAERTRSIAACAAPPPARVSSAGRPRQGGGAPNASARADLLHGAARCAAPRRCCRPKAAAHQAAALARRGGVPASPCCPGTAPRT